MATNGIFGDPDRHDPEPEADAADAANYDAAGNIKGGPLDDHPELTRRRYAVHEIERMRAEHIQKMHALGDDVPLPMKRELDEFTRLLDEAKAKYNQAAARVFDIDDEIAPVPSEADFEQLRASIPRPPRYPALSGHIRPNAGGVGAGIPHDEYGADPFANPCAPGSHEDAVAEVAADLRARGGRVSFPSQRRRRTRVRDRFWRWVFSVAEDFIEDLAERLIEAKMHLDVGVDDLDPLPPLRSTYPFASAPSVYDDYPELDPFAADRGRPYEVPQYDGEESFANRLYCGVFGKGGIGR